MIRIENVEVCGWRPAIRGMRNPLNSWTKSDTTFVSHKYCTEIEDMILTDVCGGVAPLIGINDKNLMVKLRDAGTDHRKFMRMITVCLDITAPLYWWKEFDTYKVGTVANSCSTMHKIASKEFTLDDFSHENLIQNGAVTVNGHEIPYCWLEQLEYIIYALNFARDRFNETGDKQYWWQLIQLLPSSYNQCRTIQLNYEVLANIYKSRKHHKLDEWLGFCAWIETLPYSELIIGGESE